MFDSLIRTILSSKVYDVTLETSVDQAHFLSQKLNKTILFKREDQQPIHSFKCRGAYNKIINLPEFERQKGIIAASAGNHAQGVALAAQRLNVSAVIVMPTTTPDIKVRSVRSRGVEVLLFGDSFDDAYEESLRLSSERQLTFIHPFDDIDVIAGQGTVALELMRQVTQPIDAVFIPVGGGGLAAGMAAYIKYLRPEIKVIGVEPEDAASLSAALKADERVLLESVGLFADGVAVKQIGEENFRILRKTCDDVITVTTDEICAAVKDVFNDVRSVSEPAGAVAVAGLKKYATTSDTQGALVAV
jgi:threonine dehydratase